MAIPQREGLDAFMSAMSVLSTSMNLLDDSNPCDIDEQGFTCMDLREAVGMMNDVVAQRRNETFNQYNGDAIAGYPMLYNSIMEDMKEAIRTNFTAPNGRTLRFVHMFNNLIVEQTITALKTTAPERMVPLMETIRNVLVDELDQRDNVELDSVKYHLTQHALRQKNKQRLADMRG